MTKVTGHAKAWITPLTALTTQARGENLPANFSRYPTTFYSGGYRFAEVRTETIGSLRRHRGLEYLQRTSGHGLPRGRELIHDGAVELVASAQGVRIEGFSEAIVLPFNWSGMK